MSASLFGDSLPKSRSSTEKPNRHSKLRAQMRQPLSALVGQSSTERDTKSAVGQNELTRKKMVETDFSINRKDESTLDEDIRGDAKGIRCAHATHFHHFENRKTSYVPSQIHSRPTGSRNRSKPTQAPNMSNRLRRRVTTSRRSPLKLTGMEQTGSSPVDFPMSPTYHQNAITPISHLNRSI